MSEYYILKEKAGLEALGDMQLDTIDGILDFTNELIVEMHRTIERCDIRGISFGSHRITQQIEYAKEISNNSMAMFPHEISERHRRKISNVEADFIKMIADIGNKCECSVKP